MSDALEDLRLEIRITDDPGEKFELISQLARELYTRSDYHGALQAARDALEVAERAADIRLKARGLRMVSGLEEALSDFNGALATGRRGLRLFKTLGDREGEGTMLLNIGIIHYRLGEYPKALEALEESRELLRGLGHPGHLANVLMTSARIHATIGNFGGALEGLLEALAIVEGGADTDIRAALLVNIGCTYFDAGEPEEAEQFWLRGLEQARQANDQEVMRRVLTDLGILNRGRNQPEKGLSYLKEALAIAEEMNDQAAAIQILGDIGSVYHLLGDQTTALKHLASARDSARARGDKMNELYALENIATVMVEVQGAGEGISALEDALRLCREIGARSREWELHRGLAAAYDAAGDIARAYDHFRAYAEIREEVMGKEQQKIIDNLRMRHEIETARKERDIFRLENEKLQLELRNKKSELTSMALHLAQKNEVLEKLKNDVVQMVNAATGDAQGVLKRLVPLIQQSIGSEREWEAFEHQFVEVHPGFTEALLARAPDLSPTEIRVASLLRIQMNTKDIAMLMSVTTRAVEKHRLQMRKKLKLEGSESLPAFLVTLG